MQTVQIHHVEPPTGDYLTIDTAWYQKRGRAYCFPVADGGLCCYSADDGAYLCWSANIKEAYCDASLAELDRGGASGYNSAILSSVDKCIAYVSRLGKPDTTITVSAASPAGLVRLLWGRYKLAPTSKAGVFAAVA